jgi:hypothetical protein
MIGHRAYSFDPLKFHMDLAARVTRNGTFRPELLHELVVEIAAHPSDVTREVLGWIRYDEEDWLEEDHANLDLWYLIALAGAVVPAPHLSMPSYNTMKEGLPSVGWSSEEVRELLFGKNLDLLPEVYGYGFFHQTFRHLRQHGGWLDLADANSLLAKLGAVEERFALPAPILVEAVRYYAGFLGAEPSTLIKPAYDQARTMLQTAIDRGHALFLSLFD